MKIDSATLDALVRGARQLGEDEVTLPFQDGTITIRFNPRAPQSAGAAMVARWRQRLRLSASPHPRVPASN